MGRGGDSEVKPFSSNLPLSLSPRLPLFVTSGAVAGTSCAAVFVAAQGSASLLGITRQLVGEAWLGANGFKYAGSIGPWPVSDMALATITRIGRVIAEAFELLGLFGVDLVIDGDKVWTIEVNPRYTASVEIVERAMGICAVALHASACAEGLGARDSGLWVSGSNAVQPPVPSPQSPTRGKVILFAKRDINVPKQFTERRLPNRCARLGPVCPISQLPVY